MQAPPVGSGAKPQPTNDLVPIRTKKNGSGGDNLDFRQNKSSFFSAHKQAEFYMLQYVAATPTTPMHITAYSNKTKCDA